MSAAGAAFSAVDHAHMALALRLAERGLYTTQPNPRVGCVIAQGEEIRGQGWHERAGEAHAEVFALRDAGARARGATAYVTLEPCSHWGKTPPCAEALNAAGVRRVVVSVEDPDPRVAGGGLARLREAGIAVESGLYRKEAAELNAGFFQRVRAGRPLVTLKLATSLDGRIATASGESRWITGPAARERTHLLRATHDAILVGTATVLADDPQLTCRLEGLEHRSPVRIALDRNLVIPHDVRLVAEARRTATWFITVSGSNPGRREALRDAGIEIFDAIPDESGQVDLRDVLRLLGERGLTRLLVEGGGRLAASLLRAGLVDRLVWLHAPLLLGGDGVPSVNALGLDALAEAPGFDLLSSERVGPDLLSTYRLRTG